MYLQLKNLYKKYQDNTVVSNFNIDVEKGELISILGPSGCGKTTTLRMIAGFITPTSGDIFLSGEKITDYPPETRPVSTVFQNYALFPHLTVYENIEYGLRYPLKVGKKLDKKEKKERTERIINLVNLKGLEKRRIDQLSGGQQQRVALARSLVLEPKVLLLDEPLSNIDTKLRETVRNEIREARKLTDKPFGVNVMLMSPHAEEIAKVVVEEGIKVVTTGAGSPEKYMQMWKEAGIVVIPVVASVALARRMERCGADAVVAEGTESGGHIGEATTMTLVPQVVNAVDIPVIAAGGIADGRGLAAALMLGAKAVQIGTRFVVANESIVHENYKDRVIAAKDIDSAVTGRSHGHPVRSLRNAMTREYTKLEAEGKSFEELEYLTLGTLRKAVMEGDVVNGTVMAGQIAGLINKKQSAKEIIDEIISEATNLLKNAGSLV